MATVNTRLRENPILQKMPKSEREWINYQNELAKWVLRVAKLGDGSLTTSGGTTITGLPEMPGKVPSERSINMVNVGNKSSLQSATTLSSTDAGASATISIAAHNLVTSAGAISYSAGSVTGLSYNTAYYVYTDDEDYAGGAVTYYATTTATDVVGDLGRYYLGSITSALEGTSSNINNITNGATTTIEMTSTHGWSTGNTVLLENIIDDGPDGDLETALNDQSFSITVTSTTEFTVPVNSSGFTNVYASAGTGTRTSTGTSGGFGGGGGYGDGPIP